MSHIVFRSIIVAVALSIGLTSGVAPSDLELSVRALLEREEATEADWKRIYDYRDQLREVSGADYGGYAIGENPAYTHVYVVRGKEDAVPKAQSRFVIFHPVRYSLAELLAFQEQISAHWNELHVNYTYVDVYRNRVRIGLYQPEGGEARKLREILGDDDRFDVVIESSPMVEQ